VGRELEDIGPLKIIVCIKQVPLLSALRFDPETRRLVGEGVPLEVNELLPLLIELLEYSVNTPCNPNPTQFTCSNIYQISTN